MGNQRLIQTQTAATDRKQNLDKPTKQSEHSMQEVLGSRAASRHFRAQLQRHQSEGASSPNPLHTIFQSISPVSPRAIQAKPKFRGLSHELTSDIGSNGIVIQAKMTIGAPTDKYEQEADRVAQQVVQRLNAPKLNLLQSGRLSRASQNESQSEQSFQRETLPDKDELQMSPLADQIQRMDMPEEDDELQMKPMLQRNTGGGALAATTELESTIQQSRGGGQPLADSIRQPLEQAFGADFSRVKVHADVQADTLNQSMQAHAFTTGQDIFFRQRAYNPGSQSGQKLLAHELTHVIQQNGSLVQRQSGDGAKSSNKGELTKFVAVSQLGVQRNIVQRGYLDQPDTIPEKWKANVIELVNEYNRQDTTQYRKKEIVNILVNWVDTNSTHTDFKIKRTLIEFRTELETVKTELDKAKPASRGPAPKSPLKPEVKPEVKKPSGSSPPLKPEVKPEVKKPSGSSPLKPEVKPEVKKPSGSSPPSQPEVKPESKKPSGSIPSSPKSPPNSEVKLAAPIKKELTSGKANQLAVETDPWKTATLMSDPDLLGRHKGKKTFILANKEFAEVQQDSTIGSVTTSFESPAEVKLKQQNVQHNWGIIQRGTSYFEMKGSAVTTSYRTAEGPRTVKLQADLRHNQQEGHIVIDANNKKHWVPAIGFENKSGLGSIVASNRQTYWVPKGHSEEIEAKFVDKSSGPLFPQEGPQIKHIKQGQLGNCYLMAALASITEKDPGFPQDMMQDNNDTVTVRLFDVTKSSTSTWAEGEKAGEYAPAEDFTCTPKYIKINKSVAQQTGKDLYGEEYLWVQMVEKAYAAGGFKGNLLKPKKVEGVSYENIESGSSKFAFEVLLGQQASFTSLGIKKTKGKLKDKELEKNIYDRIEAALKDGKAVGAGTRKLTPQEQVLAVQEGLGHSAGESKLGGIVAGHAYSVLGVKNGNQIKLRNPWGQYGRDVHGNVVKEGDGTVEMPMDQFLKWFDTLAISEKVERLRK
jgi:Domain of unknown function (DUF4157)/Calpain family cysteine protease